MTSNEKSGRIPWESKWEIGDLVELHAAHKLVPVGPLPITGLAEWLNIPSGTR